MLNLASSRHVTLCKYHVIIFHLYLSTSGVVIQCWANWHVSITVNHLLVTLISTASVDWGLFFCWFVALGSWWGEKERFHTLTYMVNPLFLKSLAHTNTHTLQIMDIPKNLSPDNNASFCARPTKHHCRQTNKNVKNILYLISILLINPIYYK